MSGLDAVSAGTELAVSKSAAIRSGRRATANRIQQITASSKGRFRSPGPGGGLLPANQTTSSGRAFGKDRSSHRQSPIPIGFLFGDFYGAYTANLFSTVMKACREYGQNIVGFGGGFLKSPGGAVLGENCNFIYDLAGRENIDGLIVEGSIGNFISKKEMDRFLQKYAGIPIVNIGTNIEGVNNILIDNKKGMRDLVTHMIEYHGHKKLAFMTGTDGNWDAIQRFEAYEEVLRCHDIAVDYNRIVNGNFSYFGGGQAFQTLWEERKADFDALLCANDYEPHHGQRAFEETQSAHRRKRTKGIHRRASKDDGG
jgi:hypothetical protein